MTSRRTFLAAIAGAAVAPHVKPNGVALFATSHQLYSHRRYSLGFECVRSVDDAAFDKACRDLAAAYSRELELTSTGLFQ